MQLAARVQLVCPTRLRVHMYGESSTDRGLGGRTSTLQRVCSKTGEASYARTGRDVGFCIGLQGLGQQEALCCASEWPKPPHEHDG